MDALVIFGGFVALAVASQFWGADSRDVFAQLGRPVLS
jgi:hypothetical protein